jgi:hypothetical protein
MNRDREELPRFIKNATVGLHPAVSGSPGCGRRWCCPRTRSSSAAGALAEELAAGPTAAFGEIKNLPLSTWEQPIEAQMELEARAMARVCRTDDAWTGVTEVADRCTPEFRGH